MSHRIAVKIVALVAGCLLFAAACGGSEDASGDFCAGIAALDGLDPTTDVDLSSDNPGEAMSAAFSEMGAAFEGLKEDAPAEISDEMTLLSDGINTLAEALEEADGDLFALAGDPAMVERLEALDSPDFDAAAEKIEEYARTECGVELG